MTEKIYVTANITLGIPIKLLSIYSSCVNTNADSIVYHKEFCMLRISQTQTYQTFNKQPLVCSALYPRQTRCSTKKQAVRIKCITPHMPDKLQFGHIFSAMIELESLQ
jgi:hypothetical protein